MRARPESVHTTPAREGSELADRSKVITWLSEKRRNPHKSRLSLPFPRTPVGSRPLYSSLLRSVQQQRANGRRAITRDLESVWKGLLNKTWHIYKVSPLHQFSFEASALQLYSKHLSAHLEAVTSNTAIGIEDCIKNVKIQASRNKDLVEVTLLQKQKDGTSKTVLTTILFSPKPDMTDDDLHKSFTSLPLMLVKGSTKLADHLITWWQVQFDSCITKFLVSPLQLIWLAAMFVGITTGDRSKPVEFVYKVSEEVKGLSTITYSINAADCQRIWQSIHKDKEEICTPDQVVAFMSSWDEHFNHHFGVCIQALQLLTVGTAVVHVSNDGRLKIYSSEHVQQVLVYLAEEALKQNLT